MQLDQELVDAAIALAAARWPVGEAGAAALYTSSGRILTSVAPESPNESASLCHETGAICEAHKLQESVTASVCVSRDDANSPVVVLPPCGICCERFAFWGGDVQCAVPHPDDPTRWQMKRLKQLLPHYWRNTWLPGTPNNDA